MAVVLPKVLVKQQEASLHSLLTSKAPYLHVHVPKMKQLQLLLGAYPGTPMSAAVFSGGHQKLTLSRFTADINSLQSRLKVSTRVSSRAYSQIQGENIIPPHHPAFLLAVFKNSSKMFGLTQPLSFYLDGFPITILFCGTPRSTIELTEVFPSRKIWLYFSKTFFGSQYRTLQKLIPLPTAFSSRQQSPLGQRRGLKRIASTECEIIQAWLTRFSENQVSQLRAWPLVKASLSWKSMLMPSKLFSFMKFSSLLEHSTASRFWVMGFSRFPKAFTSSLIPAASQSFFRRVWLSLEEVARVVLTYWLRSCHILRGSPSSPLQVHPSRAIQLYPCFLEQLGTASCSRMA